MVCVVLLDFCQRFYWKDSKDGRCTRDKVAWSTLTLPKSKGGLGLIDPEVQSKSFVIKVNTKRSTSRG